MKTKYHKRQNPILHGDVISHHPNNTGILVDVLWRAIKYNIIKYKRRNG
jgi:hypothetical protein